MGDTGNGFFLSHGDFYTEPPERGYARLDRVEEGIAQFELIDAEWIEKFPGALHDGKSWEAASANAPVSVIEARVVPLFEGEELIMFELPTHDKPKMIDVRETPHPWLTIRLGGGSGDGLFYANLFGEGRPIALLDADPMADELVKNLESAFSLARFVKSFEDVKALLSRSADLATIEWVVVYDVGQGGAVGLSGIDGSPVAYFDLGGGVLGNKHTFDRRLDAMCFTHEPLIILSHWDWDHWSSALRFPASESSPWLVPDQSLGAVHSAMAMRLAAQSNLHVWPQNLQQVSAGQLTLHKCTGRGRNHSGLALEVDGPSREPPILLPGDARYSAIPGAMQQQWTSVVVPHHGADMRNGQVPSPMSIASSRCVYSCGAGNTYNHPNGLTESRHDLNGWPHTSTRSIGAVDRRTDQCRTNNALGHIGMSWRLFNRTVSVPCSSNPWGAACRLSFSQQ